MKMLEKMNKKPVSSVRASYEKKKGKESLLPIYIDPVKITEMYKRRLQR